MMKKLFLTTVLFFSFTFFFRSNLMAASWTICNYGIWISACSRSASYNVTGGECKQDNWGDWYCAKKTFSGSQSCKGLGWEVAGCDGCGILVQYSTCTDSTCASSLGTDENWTYYHKYCCKSSDGSCANKTGSYCSNPAACNNGSVINEGSSGGNWTWNCSGTCGGGNSSQCTADKKTKYSNACGTAANVQYYQGVTLPAAANLCGANNTSSGLTNGSNGLYSWTCTGQCQDSGVGCSAPNDVLPVVTPTIMLYPDVTGTPSPVPREVRSGVSINNICQSVFNGSTKAIWKVTATDANGLNDIKSIQLRFTPVSGGTPITINPQTPVNGVASFVMETKDFTADTYRVEYQLEDMDDPPGKGSWTDSTRNFKVWDCLVGIGGTMYDGSSVTSISCSANRGFTNLISDKKVFGLAYSAGEGQRSEMSVTSPYFSSNGEAARKLKWSETTTYTADFDQFPGIEPNQAKVNGRCVSNITLNLGDTRVVDPYTSNPQIAIQYSAIMDQDAWFSVNNGSILSIGKVDNYVPATCAMGSSDATKCRTSVDGVVWSKDSTNSLSTYDTTLKKYFGKSLNIKNYTYGYLKNNYFSKLGVGTTVTGSGEKQWSNIGVGLTGIILIQGDLEIDEDINDNQFRVIIVEGTIAISSHVKQVNAVLVANLISALGKSDDQLIINGSVYGYNSVDFRRSFSTKMNNNTNPAVKVNYDPSIIFKMPKEVAKVITQWRLE